MAARLTGRLMSPPIVRTDSARRELGCRLSGCITILPFQEDPQMTHSLSRSGFLVLLIVLVLMQSLRTSEADETPPGEKMTTAVEAFLATLDGEQKQMATFDFDDQERLNWHFIPRERKGLGLWDLSGKALSAAERFVAAGLSTAGYEKALQVRSLEEVLYLFEGGDEAERRLKRHPHRYYLSVFGNPSGTDPWGWRFEGHHVSLNYTVQDGKVLSSTPEFFGANPGLIDAGPSRSLRVLGRREDLARSILKAASNDQRAVIWISKQAPRDIRGAGAAQAVVGEPEGVALKDMNPEQRKLLRQLIAEYLKAMPARVVRERTNAIHETGSDNIYFAWWGRSELNEPHHYVVQGPTFIIEYNNTQNSANHVHSIWRNLSGDFNIPVR